MGRPRLKAARGLLLEILVPTAPRGFGGRKLWFLIKTLGCFIWLQPSLIECFLHKFCFLPK